MTGTSTFLTLVGCVKLFSSVNPQPITVAEGYTVGAKFDKQTGNAELPTLIYELSFIKAISFITGIEKLLSVMTQSC